MTDSNDVDTGVSIDLCSFTESSWTLNKRCILGLADICLRIGWRWTLNDVHAGTSIDLFYFTESSLTRNKRCILASELGGGGLGVTLSHVLGCFVGSHSQGGQSGL